MPTVASLPAVQAFGLAMPPSYLLRKAPFAYSAYAFVRNGIIHAQQAGEWSHVAGDRVKKEPLRSAEGFFRDRVWVLLHGHTLHGALGSAAHRYGVYTRGHIAQVHGGHRAQLGGAYDLAGQVGDLHEEGFSAIAADLEDP